MVYKVMVTIKKGNKENDVFMEFTDEDMVTAMKTVEGMLKFSQGDEVTVFVRRVKE